MELSVPTDAPGRRSWGNPEVKVVGPTTEPLKIPAGQFRAIEIQKCETWAKHSGIRLIFIVRTLRALSS